MEGLVHAIHGENIKALILMWMKVTCSSNVCWCKVIHNDDHRHNYVKNRDFSTIRYNVTNSDCSTIRYSGSKCFHHNSILSIKLRIKVFILFRKKLIIQNFKPEFGTKYGIVMKIGCFHYNSILSIEFRFMFIFIFIFISVSIELWWKHHNSKPEFDTKYRIVMKTLYFHHNSILSIEFRF